MEIVQISHKWNGIYITESFQKSSLLQWQNHLLMPTQPRALLGNGMLTLIENKAL